MNKLTYTDALELKNAGFPQGGEGNFVIYKGVTPSGNKPSVYEPTLDELIEDIKRLEGSLSSFTLRCTGAEWEASLGYMNNKRRTGKTSIKSVKNLWIALNKK